MNVLYKVIANDPETNEPFDNLSDSFVRHFRKTRDLSTNQNHQTYPTDTDQNGKPITHPVINQTSQIHQNQNNNSSKSNVDSALSSETIDFNQGPVNIEAANQQINDINNNGHSEAFSQSGSFSNELPVDETTIPERKNFESIPSAILFVPKSTWKYDALTCWYLMTCGPCCCPSRDPFDYIETIDIKEKELSKSKNKIKQPWLDLKNCSPKNYYLSISMPKCKPPTCISFKCPHLDCFKSKPNSDVSKSKNQTNAATKSKAFTLTGQLVVANNDDMDCLNPESLWTCFGNETQQEVSNNAIENIDYSNCIIIDYDPFKQCSDMTEFAYATTTTCVINVSNQCPDPTEITCPDETEYTRCFNEFKFPDLSPFFQCFADNTLDSISTESSNEDDRLHNQEDTRHYMAYLFCCCIGIISFCKQSNPSSHNLKCATDSISILNFLNLCSNKCNTQSCDNFKQYLECCTIQPCTSAPMNCVRYVKSCSSDCNDRCCDALSSCCVKIKRSFCTPPDCDIPNPTVCVDMFVKCAYGCFCRTPYNCISNAC